MMHKVHTDGHNGNNWYVVHTQPACEARAAMHLAAQGYTIFCPNSRKTVRHARKSTSKLVPLFPGYLFLSLDLSRDRWRSINGTRGVLRLLTQGDVPQAVPAGIVETLQARTDSQGVLALPPALSVGQRVCIMEGPLANLVGTLQRLDGADRVQVLLDLLGRSVPATIQVTALDPAA
jgi:transcription elongation factor/antiterminator RfaH